VPVFAQELVLIDVHTTATKFALRSVARRCQRLSEEIAELDEQLDRLVADAAPELSALPGIALRTMCSDAADSGLKDNPQRLKSEASFARASLRSVAHRSVLGKGGGQPPTPQQRW
jgi:transposase